MFETRLTHNYKSRQLTKQFLQSSPSELQFVKFITIVLTVWFACAHIISIIYPSTFTSTNIALVYLGYALRNGGTFILICGFIHMIRMILQTADVPLGTYLKDNQNNMKLAAIRTLLMSIIGLCFFAIFIASFSTIKTRIPAMNPYQWDNSFMLWDKFLFFGHDPWTLFAWIYDIPVLIRTMDFMYDAWAGLLVGMWTLCFINRKHSAAIRYRFPIALMLTWFIGGTLLATLFSSVGPCYFEALTGDAAPYAEQMTRLAQLHNEEPLRVLPYQELLWNVYASGTFGLGGISAMPSMHCGTSALFVLMAWKNPIWRSLALTFFVFIFISSFMLAWHYAVDGLLVIPVVIFAWWAAGKIANKVSGQTHG